MTIYFIGAGPGDPDLITVKGQQLIRRCPIVLYAGSLVPKAVILEANPKAEIINTAELYLEQIIDRMRAATEQGQDVARVHSGDPSIYGAIAEQIRWLERLDIAYEVIPGVTSASASAAALGRELTLPGISQTVILTRYAGKTAMPVGETLAELAQHRATLIIHLGINRIHKIVDELIPCYGPDCPVVVMYRTSWPDHARVTGTLEDIVDKVRAKGFHRTALILVGAVFDPPPFNDSFLYDEGKAHVYRPKYQRKRRTSG